MHQCWSSPGPLGILALILLLPPLATPALAQDEIEAEISYGFYELEADSLPGLQAEMNLEGPYGFPAYTTWQVNWTAACEMTVTATIVLPDLGPDADLSAADEAAFREMAANLEDHEENHVDFALGFAREVQEMGCRGDTTAVHQEWLAAERQYDSDTEHGRTEGAWLNDE